MTDDIKNSSVLMRLSVAMAVAWLSISILSAAEGEPAPDAAFTVPPNVFAGEQRGAWQTGTFEELWIDTQRGEPTTTDPEDKRHLMVQVWYPAQFNGNPPRAPYALHRELYPDDEDARWLDDAKAVRTNSVLRAPLPKHAARFPVLIYNPGGVHPPFSATFQTEYLASHGYVVVAIGHTGLTRIERFPDGYRYRQDVSSWVTDAQAQGLSGAERFRLQVKQHAESLMPVHVQDIRFVLDKLQALNETRGSRFYRRLDLERVGSLGWSLGGALSLQASRDEPRIKAAVNVDGWLYTDVPQTGTHRPIMQIHSDDSLWLEQSDQTAAGRELAVAADSLSWQLYARSEVDWYDLTLLKATHSHFSDRTLFEPAPAEVMHPRLAHDIVNRVTLEFFDKYLRQSTATPLLSGQQHYADTKLLTNVKSGEKRADARP